MIKIDIPMPICCGDCPCFDSEMFVCKLSGNDNYHFDSCRDDECPLEEENDEE